MCGTVFVVGREYNGLLPRCPRLAHAASTLDDVQGKGSFSSRQSSRRNTRGIEQLAQRSSVVVHDRNGMFRLRVTLTLDPTQVASKVPTHTSGPRSLTAPLPANEPTLTPTRSSRLMLLEAGRTHRYAATGEPSRWLMLHQPRDTTHTAPHLFCMVA